MRGPGRSRGGPGRLSALFPSSAGSAARTPFVLLVVVLLGSGLITLLLLNSALNQGSFELSNLEKKTDELTDEQQALQQQVDGYSAPGALERRARELGMVPGGNPAFLLPDGTVLGKPGKAGSAMSPMGAGGPEGLGRPLGQGVPAASVHRTRSAPVGAAGRLLPEPAPGAPAVHPLPPGGPTGSAPDLAAAPAPTTFGR
ncbi:septum formation initiator family protein [Streptomyces sp. NPDC017993]|uniref:septum formation initiator family protein n=1 Tax=Streptomyces sp. NPDC017993 TaxID=3365027 RepID=UPI0037ACBE6B